MRWNWQAPEWPDFTYKKAHLHDRETRFLQAAGMLSGTLRHIQTDDKDGLIIDLISTEALKTSEIEGELLNRDSVQSSIRRHFGLDAKAAKAPPAEQGIAEMMVNLYKNFNTQLTHEQLFDWHRMLTNGRRDLRDIGVYRTHEEPMQVVSGAIHAPKVHFEAPPSTVMKREMNAFIKWFNATAPNGKAPLPALTRAAIAHLYFVCVHPFEDGNGRIGRAIAEKALSQSLGQPTLIALSSVIESKKKAYYDALERNNKDCEISDWMEYFAQTIIAAQEHTQKRIDFLIEKTRFYEKYRGHMNARQEKVIARMFREGVDGFKGGLSAENYITITATSRATATRDLADLVSKEILHKTGELRHTRYWLNVTKDN